MENKPRVAVLFDGSNFYHKLKSLQIKSTSRFNYRQFAVWLAREGQPVFCAYYVGVVRAKEGDTKGQQLRQAQVNLFNHLRSPEQQFIIRQGYLMRNDGKFHEKGVDVRIAVDMLVGAYEKLYDRVVLISSDTDLIPAINKVRQLGKEVEYIGFAHQPSFALVRHANTARFLDEKDLVPFVYKPM